MVSSMSECAHIGCHIPAKCTCSACLIEQYCSSSCQKLDWKVHKAICPVLKKLSIKKLQPFKDVAQIIHHTRKTDNDTIRIMEHLKLYAEYQFGERTVGIDYREREDGERMSNWLVEMVFLLDLNISLSHLNSLIKEDDYMAQSNREILANSYLRQILKIVKPWLIQLDLDPNSNPNPNPNSNPDFNQINGLDEDQITYLLERAWDSEQLMAAATMNNGQFDIAEVRIRVRVSS
jgi:hypothetical protein